MKVLGRARVRWAAAFALVLFASLSASVWAELPAALEPPSAQEAPETTPLPSPLGGDHIRLPDAQEVANGIAQHEEVEAGALEQIASPAAATTTVRTSSVRSSWLRA